MRIHPCLSLVVLVAACAPAPPTAADLEALRHELMEADRAFDQAVQDRGAEGWVATFSDDGRMLLDGGPIVTGAEAIRDVMSILDDPAYSLRWEPLGAEVSASGDLGYTWGRYVRELRRESGETETAEGKYLTVWRRDPRGGWRVAADIGNSGAPEPATPSQD